MAQEETEYEGGLKMEATRTGFYQQPYSQGIHHRRWNGFQGWDMTKSVKLNEEN